MLRTFQTHQIRKQAELSEQLWDFMPLEGEQKGKKRKIQVPGCWETYPGLENYRGKAEYEIGFEAKGNVRLEFKGVSHMAWVFVDGEQVGSHYNAYTPFSVIVPGLKQGSHLLKVLVDNSFSPEYALNRPNDYMSYGGISRGVGLEEIPDLYFTGIHITPVEKTENGWKAKCEIEVENLLAGSIRDAEIEMKLHQSLIKVAIDEVQPGKHIVYEEILEFEGIESWSVENPQMYTVELLLRNQAGEAIDDLIDRIGFRTITAKGKQILLNGRPLRIKGVCRHEDHPQYGCALPFEAIAYDMQQIRDMGCNSVRTAHYPNDERFLDLCDEMGILVWEEHHLRGGNEKIMSNPNFEPQCEQVIEEMIKYHYNHPSIYIWGILNECASDTELGRGCYEKQYALIRKLDASRLCSSASCRYEADMCMDLPDVTSWNMYPYWYERKTAAQMVDEVYRWTQEKGNGNGKPFLVTEIGAGAIYGFRSADEDPWTEEYQRDVVKKQLTEVMAYEDCVGLYIWQFCDVRVNREWFEKRPRTRNNKGIVDEFRRKKLAYDAVKEIFHQYPDYRA